MSPPPGTDQELVVPIPINVARMRYGAARIVVGGLAAKFRRGRKACRRRTRAAKNQICNPHIRTALDGADEQIGVAVGIHVAAPRHSPSGVVLDALAAILHGGGYARRGGDGAPEHKVCSSS